MDVWRGGRYHRSSGSVAARLSAYHSWERLSASTDISRYLNVDLFEATGYVGTEYTTSRGHGMFIRCTTDRHSVAPNVITVWAHVTSSARYLSNEEKATVWIHGDS